MAAGSGENIKTYRPTTASNGRSKVNIVGSPSRKETLLNERSIARLRAEVKAVSDLSVPTTSPAAPTNSAARNATSPAPLPISSTRIPAASPAFRKNCRVIGSTSWACVPSRLSSRSVWPSSYGLPAAAGPGHPCRRQDRHEDRAPKRAHGFRPEHGRALSVLAATQARRHHRAFVALRPRDRTRKPMGTGCRSVRDAQRIENLMQELQRNQQAALVVIEQSLARNASRPVSPGSFATRTGSAFSRKDASGESLKSAGSFPLRQPGRKRSVLLRSQRPWVLHRRRRAAAKSFRAVVFRARAEPC